MAASGNKALEVKVSAKVDGKKIHPTQVKIINAINTMAQASITYIHKTADANKKSTNVTAKDVFTAMAERQTKSFKDTPDSPGVVLSLQDAYDGSVNFKGNVSSPNYTFSSGDVMLTENVQPDYSSLNCMDLSIYEQTVFNLDQVKAKDYPDTIAEIIKKVITDMVEKGDKQIKGIKDKIKKAAFKKQHDINKKVIKFAEELLENSKETIGWDGVINESNKSSVVTQIRQRVTEALKGKTGGGFFNNILRVAEEFQCVYVPELDNVGKLVNKKSLLTDATTLTLHPVTLSVQAGSVGMFPVRAVIVNQPVNSQDANTSANIDRTKKANLAAMYPEDPAEGGTILSVLGPQWLPSALYDIAKIEATTEQGKSKKKKLQKNKLDKDKAKGAKKVTKSVKANFEDNEKVTEQWAETVYYWQALGQAYAIISTELNLKLQVGKRYTVKGDSGVLFSGILNSIEHTIHTSFKSSSAVSQLQFSHIVMASAKIPGIE